MEMPARNEVEGNRIKAGQATGRWLGAPCAVWARVFLLIPILFLFGCGAEKRDASLPAHWPDRLVFAYYVDDELPGLRQNATSVFAAYLERRLGMPVELLRSTQYGPIIEAMRAERIDISMFGTFSYIIAASKASAECIVTRGTESGFNGYHSIAIARADSGIENLDTLKARAKSLTFAFTNPASTSGHLIPRVYLEREGLVPERDFKQVVFPGKHNATLLAVSSGRIDVGCVSENTYNKLVSLGKIDPEYLRPIWKSPRIPDSCVAVRGSLPSDLKQRIQTALLEMREVDPASWNEARKIYQYSSNPDGHFVKIDDSHYDEVRALTRNLEEFASYD